MARLSRTPEARVTRDVVGSVPPIEGFNSFFRKAFTVSLFLEGGRVDHHAPIRCMCCELCLYL